MCAIVQLHHYINPILLGVYIHITRIPVYSRWDDHAPWYFRPLIWMGGLCFYTPCRVPPYGINRLEDPPNTISIHPSIWVFPKIVVPQNGWFIMEIPIKMDDLGVPLFSETPILASAGRCKKSLHPNPRPLKYPNASKLQPKRRESATSRSCWKCLRICFQKDI